MDLRSGNIESLPSMNQERYAHASVFVNDSIYVAGGQFESTKKRKTTLKCVEKYVNM